MATGMVLAQARHTRDLASSAMIAADPAMLQAQPPGVLLR